jgi:glycosyltransferase involved in cell wall biosynthesis
MKLMSRARQRRKLPPGPTHRGKRKVFVFCPDLDSPLGGVRVLYRHVDILNSLSIPATILHSRSGFRCTWFANTTAVTYVTSVTPSPNDIVVLPEISGPGLAGMFPGVPKVIFSQSCYLTFYGYHWDSAPRVSPYQHPEVIGVMTVSDDSVRYLDSAFPGLRTARIHNSIDGDLFYLADGKRSQISFMPRKHPDEAAQVLQLLRLKGALDGIEVVPIDGVPEEQVAQILRSSLVFLTFAHPEGFGLPPAEAMACGCIVVGYHGNGGREFFDPAFCYPIEIHDIIGFASAVELVLNQWRSEPESLSHMAQAASQFILSTYTKARETSDIHQAWSRFLERY